MLYEHLISRNFDPKLYKNIILDEDNEILTMYLNNLCGQFVGFQQYNPNVTDKKINNAEDGRYFTICQRGVTAVWGLETLDRDKEKFFVVEGCFKASSLHMLGENAVAVLTSTPKSMSTWFELLKVSYDVIAIGDNDKAGQSLVKVVGKGFTTEKDLDEYSLDELKEVISNEILYRDWK